MRITKDELTTIALGIVSEGVKYDKLELAEIVALEFMRGMTDEFGFGFMSQEGQMKLRQCIKELAMNHISWTRINRKVNPDEWADTAWRMNDPQERL